MSKPSINRDIEAVERGEDDTIYAVLSCGHTKKIVGPDHRIEPWLPRGLGVLVTRCLKCERNKKTGRRE